MKVLFVLLLVAVAAQAMSINSGSKECPQGNCICIALFDPVCSTDGCTYSNSCFMACAGGKLWHRGPCAENPGPRPR